MAWQGTPTTAIDAFHALIPQRISLAQWEEWWGLWTDLHDDLYWIAESGPVHDPVGGSSTPWVDRIYPVVMAEIRVAVSRYFVRMLMLFVDNARNPQAMDRFAHLAEAEFLGIVPWTQIRLHLAHGDHRRSLGRSIRQYLEAMSDQLARAYWLLRPEPPPTSYRPALPGCRDVGV